MCLSIPTLMNHAVSTAALRLWPTSAAVGLALPADIQLQSQRAVTTVAAELWGQTGATLPHHVTQIPLILLLETSPPLRVCDTWSAYCAVGWCDRTHMHVSSNGSCLRGTKETVELDETKIDVNWVFILTRVALLLFTVDLSEL